MTAATWVLPSIDIAYRNLCLESMSPDVRARTLVVDNTAYNSGVSAAWNCGILEMQMADHEWLILCSESMRFGPTGGEDFERQLDHDWTDSLFGWHLVGFHRDTIERVGRFDENFFAYMEDSDYLIRLHLAGRASPRLNDRQHRWVENVDAYHEGTEHTLRAGLYRVPWSSLIAYWQRKWLTAHPEHATDHPFGIPDRDWTYWPQPGHEAGPCR